jgi:serine/threonine protein kinase
MSGITSDIDRKSKGTTVSTPVPSGTNVFGDDLNKWTLQSPKANINVEVELPTYFQVVTALGQGSYGCVIAARVQLSQQEKTMVAIKKFVFHRTPTRQIDIKRVLRELRFLRILQHENVIPVRMAFCSGSTQQKMQDIYLVTEAMDTDLHNVIRSCQHFAHPHILFFFYQLIRGLKYVHSAGIIHRDMKPKNLLVNRSCDLRIGDFGMARLYGDEDWSGNNMMTEYVCTRWYRSPELLCSWSVYDYKVDIWACGCILVEMFTKTSLFQGYNTLDQISKISALLGTPSETALAKIPNRKARHYLSKMPPTAARPLEESLGTPMSADVSDVVMKMLEWDPDLRPDCAQLLEFPYVAELHEVEDEPSRDHVPLDLFEYERRNVSVDFLLEELFHELFQHQGRETNAVQRQHDINSFELYNNPNKKTGEKPIADDDDDLDDENQNDPGDQDQVDDLGLTLGVDVANMTLEMN